MLPFTLLRLAFVFAVADLTHAVTLIGTGVAPASRDYRHGSTRQDPGPLVQQPAASDIPLTTHSGFNIHDSGIACQLAQRCRTLMARLSSHSRRCIALFHQPSPPKSTQRLSTFDWVFYAASATLTTLTVLTTLVALAARSTGCSTRGAATTPTLTLSLFLRVDHCTSDCLAWQRRGPSWSALHGDPAS